MSTRRQQKYQLICDGYTRNASTKNNLDIPSEITTLIFMFYFITTFDIEHAKLIKVENNKITNIHDRSDRGFGAFMNTAVIDDWMHSNSDTDHIHTIILKIIKHSLGLGIGIVEEGYNFEYPLAFSEGIAFYFFNDGIIRYKMNEIAKIDEYKMGDVVSLTLNLKSLSISYSIFNDGDIKPRQIGILLKPGEIPKTKYKWGIELDSSGDCVEIIDLYSYKSI